MPYAFRRIPAVLVTASVLTFGSMAAGQNEAVPGRDAPAAPPPIETPPTLEPAPDATQMNASPGKPRPLLIGVAAGLGLPNPLTYGIDTMWRDEASGGLYFGSFGVKAYGAEVKISNWDLRGRWHPFAGTFFVGAAYGKQTVSASLDESIKVSGSRTETTLKLEVETSYLTPHFGWLAVWDSGFTAGFDLGYQIALSSEANELDVEFANGDDPSDSDDFNDAEKVLKTAVETFGKVSVPYLTLLRVGWLF